MGGTLVSLLLLVALLGSRWTRFRTDQMDFEHLLTPPAAGWLMHLTTTEEGRKALIENNESRAGIRDQESSSAQSVQGIKGKDDENGNEAWLGALENGEQNASQVAESSLAEKNQRDARVLGDPSHLLGTDKDGRDMVALLVAGARNGLLPSAVACAVALGLGLPLGLLAGYYAGGWRWALKLFNGTLLSMPRIVLILVVICAFNPNIYLTMVVLGITLIPRISELIATRVHMLSQMGFTLAAREGGLSDFRILTRHLFWYQNRAVFFIQFSLVMAEAILMETTLSYLQFGIKPPEVSWGNMIEGSRLTFFSGQYWITFFPALAIVLAIMGFFCLGDGLNARRAYRESH
jgi:peptide/nickel transport system permease protein